MGRVTARTGKAIKNNSPIHPGLLPATDAFMQSFIALWEKGLRVICSAPKENNYKYATSVESLILMLRKTDSFQICFSKKVNR